MTDRRHPVLRRTGRIAVAALLVISLIAVGFLVWANAVMMGDREAALHVWRDPRVSITDVGDAVELAPSARASGEGLLFIPGAKVDPYAYLYKLSDTVAETGLTVVITKPTLNLAFFDQRPLSEFTRHAPHVEHWYVGGHSLGGVRACQLADDPAVSGLVLFGSYCANDLSKRALRTLSISGTRDGLSTPQKIRDTRDLLPPDATMIAVPGMNHAQFGDYGPQPGDNPSAISDDQARAAVTAALTGFFRPRRGGEDHGWVLRETSCSSCFSWSPSVPDTDG